MRNLKKLLISIITVSLSLIFLAGCIFSVSANNTYTPNLKPEAKQIYESQGYGSFDKGLLPPDGLTRAKYKWFHPSIQYGNPSVDGHPNLDFSKGYEFWYDNKDLIKMNTDKDGNTYATVIGDKEYSGLFSVKFTLSKVKKGDTISLLYKWRTPSHQRAIEGYIDQVHNVTDETKEAEQIGIANSVGGRNQVNIWLPDEDDDKEWGISLAPVYQAVEGPTGSAPITYYSVGIQTMMNVEFFKNTDFDDLQIVKYNEATGIVTDLDGNQLYNTNDLPQREVVDYAFLELGDTDPNADIKIDVEDILSGKINLKDSVNQTTNDTKDKSSFVIVAIIITVILLILIAVAIIILKKKANKKS